MSVKVGRIIKGIVLSGLVAVLTMLLITVVSYFCDVGVKVIDILMVSGLALGVLAGSFLAAKASEDKVGLYGLAVGISMLIIFLLLSYFVNGRLVFNAHSVSVICVCLISSFLGGVLGR